MNLIKNDTTNIENDDLICPITLELLHDPVVAKDGHVYERAAITRWILEHGTSPFTRQPLSINDLQSDDRLRCLAGQRRNSTVSYNAQNSSVTLPPLRRVPRNNIPAFLQTGPRLNRANHRLKICTSSKMCLFIIACIIIVPTIIGIVYGISNSSSYSTDILATELTITYPGSLATNSSVFIRPSIGNGTFYYKAIQLMVLTAAFYDFTSISTMNMSGYLYTSYFNSTNPSANLLTSDDGASGNGQFHISISLLSGNYTLVATTYSANVTGSFSIRVHSYENDFSVY